MSDIYDSITPRNQQRYHIYCKLDNLLNHIIFKNKILQYHIVKIIVKKFLTSQIFLMICLKHIKIIVQSKFWIELTLIL